MRLTTSQPSLVLVLVGCCALQETLSFAVVGNQRPAFFTALQANVVSDSILSTSAVDDSSEEESPRLSRPARKALERARKARRRGNTNHRKHNYAERKDQLIGRKPGESKLRLHSTVLPKLDPQESTADDVLRAIKRAQNLHDRHDIKAIARFLIEHTDDSFAYGYKGSLLSRLAVAALHLDAPDIAAWAIDFRRTHFRSSMQPMESAALVRNLLRVHNVTAAWEILEDELSLPLEGTSLTSSQNRDRLKHRAAALCSVASRHFFEGEPTAAVHACNKLAGLGPLLHEAMQGSSHSNLNLPWTRLVSGASQCQTRIRNGTISVEHAVNGAQRHGNDAHAKELANTKVPCNVIYSVLNAMVSLPSANDNRVYESLSNALIRRVTFIKGAVDMNGTPPPDRGEAAFIGRSNVGKSSLINMVSNRKSLAYTSKRPGKTQQFNFFAVNDKVGRDREVRYGDVVDGEKDADSFYIVDLPGFGYAKVPEQQRDAWADFMQEYISTRSSLRVLFHLIDSRHGPTEEDATIMRKVEESLPRSENGAKYVICLTKADKNVKGSNKKNSGKVPRDIMNKVEEAMKENLSSSFGDVPVLVTSAESRLGRNEVWRYLQRAAAF